MEKDAANQLGKLIDEGWAYHADESERLTLELEAVELGAAPPSLIAPFLVLATHTIGEHLGDWGRALALGKRTLDGRVATPETGKAWGALYVAAVFAGEPLTATDAELAYLKAAGDEFGAALLDMRFQLASALVNRKRAAEAARIYMSALDLIPLMPPSTNLDHNIAATSNNLAWELYEASQRTVEENALMRLAAETSLQYWLRGGNWINAELGHYLRAVVANVTAAPQEALAQADEGLAVIDANGARPFDAARLHLARAVALAALDDAEGATHAIGDADAAAAKILIEGLKPQFDSERAKVIAAIG
jgi:hypothetical protein